MKTIFSKFPLPMSGVGLAFAAIGSLAAPVNTGLKSFCGLVSAAILTIVLLKVITSFKTVLKEIENPVIASVIPTFPMALISLSPYLKPIHAGAAIYLWFAGIAVFTLLMIYYTRLILKDFSINKIFPSTFIPFVGIVVASVSAPVFGQILVGRVTFWFGLAAFAVLLPLITYRFFVVKKIPEAALPVTAIFAAPASLLLCGFHSVYSAPSNILTHSLAAISVAFTIAVLFYMVFRLLRLPFYPSYAAFGFPLVISSTAARKLSAVYYNNPFIQSVFNTIYQIEGVIAAFIVVYITIRYTLFMLKTLKTQKDEQLKTAKTSA